MHAAILRFHSSFFYSPTTPAVISPLSLHDALPICDRRPLQHHLTVEPRGRQGGVAGQPAEVVAERLLVDVADLHRDRKSTRLNSSHGYISYAVFCLKKKNK